jgi:hypothetical protein
VRRLFDLAPAGASCSSSPGGLSCSDADTVYSVDRSGIRSIVTPFGAGSREGAIVTIFPSNGGEVRVEILESVFEATDVRLSGLGREWTCCLELGNASIGEGR